MTGRRSGVLGVDSSTQSCTVVVRDLDTGAVLASGRAPHPRTTPPVSEQAPAAWWDALGKASAGVGADAEIAAVSVDGQGHGLVLLDEDRRAVRAAKLWNDTTSTVQAERLVRRLGPQTWARRTGIVPVAAFTISKLAWVCEHEPHLLPRIRQLMLPHDYLNLRLTGTATTDRSEASGTGWFDPESARWLPDLLELVEPGVDWTPMLPTVLAPGEPAGHLTGEAAEAVGVRPGTPVAAGCNDNAATALALGLEIGDVVFSLGTSGTVFSQSRHPVRDPSGDVDGNADATGAYLPLVCTLNAGKVLDLACRLLGVDHDQLTDLALSAGARPDRPVLVAYLDGERTPNRPDGTGTLAGLRSLTSREEFARAAFEGVLLGLLSGLDALRRAGLPCDGRVLLAGGAARSHASAQLLADLLGSPVELAELDDQAACGAAVQAAAVATGADVADVAQAWRPPSRVAAEPRADQHVDELRARYADLVRKG